jgi:hypothetical protein
MKALAAKSASRWDTFASVMCPAEVLIIKNFLNLRTLQTTRPLSIILKSWRFGCKGYLVRRRAEVFGQRVNEANDPYRALSLCGHLNVLVYLNVDC